MDNIRPILHLKGAGIHRYEVIPASYPLRKVYSNTHILVPQAPIPNGTLVKPCPPSRPTTHFPLVSSTTTSTSPVHVHHHQAQNRRTRSSMLVPTSGAWDSVYLVLVRDSHVINSIYRRMHLVLLLLLESSRSRSRYWWTDSRKRQFARLATKALRKSSMLCCLV